jgi:hypothetical protein
VRPQGAIRHATHDLFIVGVAIMALSLLIFGKMFVSSQQEELRQK